jgi:hypothetical protein
VERERLTRHGAPNEAELSAIADRLQQLSVGEVERVLERAIELQTQAQGGAQREMLDTDRLGRIADELDIDRRHLKTALVEEFVRMHAEEPDAWDRWFVPSRIVAQRVVPGDAATVRQALDTWMASHEGLRKRTENPVRTEWEKDGSFFTAARMKLRMSQGSGALRSLKGVSHAVRPVTDDRHLVAIEADTSRLRQVAVALLAAGGAAGVAVAGASGAADPAGFGLDNVWPGTAVAAVVGGGAWLGVRIWARRVREALARAVDAVANPHLIRGLDSVPKMVRRFLDQMRG